MTNNSKIKTMKSRWQTWAEFDALPREVKEFAWYAPYKPAFGAGMTREIYDRSLLAFAEDTARVYGLSHPGAKPWLERLPTVDF